MRIFLEKHLRIAFRSILLMPLAIALVLSTFSSNAIAAECPQGLSTNDCLAILNDWVDWVPQTCQDAISSTLGGYSLPAYTGKAVATLPIDANGKFNDPLNKNNPANGRSVAFPQFAKLGDTYRNYYIAMRWNYASWFWDGSSKRVDTNQYNWMGGDSSVSKPRLIEVTNPKTGKSIIAAALDANPAPWMGVDSSPPLGFPFDNPQQGWTDPQVGTPQTYTGDVAAMPPVAMNALGDTDGTASLAFAWAPDQTIEPGIPSTPTPTGLTAGQGDICTGGVDSINGAVFLSQRDKRWDGTILCTGAGHDRSCFTTHDEGCWATSVAMIISTFKNKLVTPMQTEGNGVPPESFWSNGYPDTGDIAVTQNNLNRAIADVRAGALVMIGGRYGVPWYNTKQHWEVIRGVTASGQILVNDPWDLPDPANPQLPLKTTGYIQYDGRSQFNSARSYGTWDQSDILAHGFAIRIVGKKGQHI